MTTSAAKANRNAAIVDRLEAENARLRAPFKHADALDWDYLQRILITTMRSQEDSQTRFWIEVVKELRDAYEQQSTETK